MAERLAQDEESRSVTWQSSRISTTTAATPSKTRPTGLVLGMLYGLGFAVLASPPATTLGSALLWGLPCPAPLARESVRVAHSNDGGHSRCYARLPPFSLPCLAHVKH